MYDAEAGYYNVAIETLTSFRASRYRANVTEQVLSSSLRSLSRFSPTRSSYFPVLLKTAWRTVSREVAYPLARRSAGNRIVARFLKLSLGTSENRRDGCPN